MVNSYDMKRFSVISLIVSLLFILSCEDKVEKDTTPPLLTIVFPTSGSTVGEVVKIKVETSDDSGILKVDFYVPNTNVVSDTTSPYEYDWNTTSNEDGEYKIKVMSYDTKENFVESEVSVTIDNNSKKPSPLDIVSVDYTIEKMTVKWNQSQESDFKQYNLHYSESENGTKKLVKMISDITMISYDTTSFDPTKENWYFVEVVDNFGLKNIGKGKTNQIESPPIPSQIDTIIYDYINESFSIRWTENKETDFKSYTIYESDFENMSSKTNLLVMTNSTQLINSVGVEKSLYKYYQIETEDVWGLKSQSDIKEGNSFIFVFHSTRDGDEELYLMSLDGTIQKKLTDNEKRDVNVLSKYFSPDGKKIVFNSEIGGTEDIYIIDLDENNETNLTSNLRGNINGYNLSFNPVFSPDGSKILFYSNVNDSGEGCCDIYIMNVDGTNQINLTNDNQLHTNYRSQFLPNDSRIVYTTSKRDSDPDDQGIWSVDLDGNNKKQLCTDCFDSSVSPDGSKIIYVSDKESNWDDIYMMDSDGSNKINLSNDNYPNSQPVFSPDGMKIVYTSFQNTLYGIHIMDVDGKNKLKLSDGESGYPDFTPDGSKVLFQSHPYGGNGSDIYIMNVDGTNKVNITKNDSWNRSPQFRPR